jgi:hypothetical protein
MEKEYNSKLNEPIHITFKVEKTQDDLLNGYCDEHGLNKSAVLRRMLVDFLKKLGVY